MLKLPFMEQISRFCQSWSANFVFDISAMNPVWNDLTQSSSYLWRKINIIYKYCSQIAFLLPFLHVLKQLAFARVASSNVIPIVNSVWHSSPSQKAYMCFFSILHELFRLLKNVHWGRNGAHVIAPASVANLWFYSKGRVCAKLLQS